MARNSVMRVRSVAVMALKHAQRRDLVARNAAELAEMPVAVRPASEGRSLNLVQARRLLAEAKDDRVGPLVVVGLMLGLRPGELCGLRWADVDFKRRIAHVRQSLKRERDADGREVLRFGAASSRVRGCSGVRRACAVTTEDVKIAAPAQPPGARGRRAPAPALAASQERLQAGAAWRGARSRLRHRGR